MGPKNKAKTKQVPKGASATDEGKNSVSKDESRRNVEQFWSSTFSKNSYMISEALCIKRDDLLDDILEYEKDLDSEFIVAGFEAMESEKGAYSWMQGVVPECPKKMKPVLEREISNGKDKDTKEKDYKSEESNGIEELTVSEYLESKLKKSKSKIEENALVKHSKNGEEKKPKKILTLGRIPKKNHLLC